jgi:hypothetical protein
MTNKCKNCSKPIGDNLSFCSKECVKQFEEKQKQPAIVVASNNGFTNDLRDGAFQNGIKWRKGKLEAIHKARQAELTDEQILRELRISGITCHKAIELMTESEELFGR